MAQALLKHLFLISLLSLLAIHPLFSDNSRFSLKIKSPSNITTAAATQVQKYAPRFASKRSIKQKDRESTIRDPELKILLPMNEIDHPVSTNNTEAQKKFNQGVTYIFAYNHDLAFKEFEKASQLDPDLAMAYWGMALSLGQNINRDVTPENEKRAYAYAQRALALIAKASAVEQAYIKAIVQRYTDDPEKDLVPLRFIYRAAMKKVSNDYPEDLDAASLYAESILNLDPWKYWTWDGRPKEGTMEAIALLQSVLDRNPDHIGANHYYIHALEASPTPDRALMSAFRLTSLLPESGHLLHMPCHIFILCGYYAEAIKTSQRAIAADREYIKENGMGGEYPLHYLSHNLKILARAYMLAEDYDRAIQTSEELQQFLAPYYENMPNLAKSLITSMEINLYFHRWNALLTLKPPVIFDAAAQTYWHFSRALASINLGHWEAYQQERDLMLKVRQKISPDEEIANNPASQVFELCELLLDAAVDKFQNNFYSYIEKLKKAVDQQDRLNYDEPPAWYISLRIELGQALLKAKNYKDAEQVFKKGLRKLQRNGRLLFGLYSSLRAQDRAWDAYWVEREARSAFKNATQHLTLDFL